MFSSLHKYAHEAKTASVFLSVSIAQIFMLLIIKLFKLICYKVFLDIKKA